MSATDSSHPVVVISHDVVGEHMAGPGIRYYHLARVLAREFEVVLAVPPYSTPTHTPDLRVLLYASGTDPALVAALQSARAVLVPAVTAHAFPTLKQLAVPIAIDGYDPVTAETLVVAEYVAREQQAALTQACLLGDFFICASERQRDWWLGCLEAHGRINRHTHGNDPSLRQLVDLVPFGFPDAAPRHTRAVIKGVWPGIAKTDRVVLWGGGLWPWLDPLTAIQAMALIAPQQPNARLIFPGTRHPNPGVAAAFNLATAAKALAAELGLLNTSVFFGDWVAYADWPNVLCESDIALTLSPDDTLETRLAFRSRVMDYIWAGLPIIASRGDATSELVAEHGVGEVVENTPDAVARVLLELLAGPREQFASHFAAAQKVLTWERAAQPLTEFCRNARRAADRPIVVAKHKREVTSKEPQTGMNVEILEEYVRNLEWYHTIDLGQGIITPGHYDHRPFLTAYGIPNSLAGKTALDIGAASGFFSFEMERRGGQVTAVDLPHWAAHDFGPQYQFDKSPSEGDRYLHEPFLLARRALGSNVNRLEMNVYDLVPESVGTFDLVFCGSMLLHLTDPVKALWRIQQVTAQAAILTTAIAWRPDTRPQAEFVGHHRGDVWWLPNRTGFEAMVQSAGFRGWEWFSDFRLDYRDGRVGPYHGVIRAWNTPEKPGWLDLVEPPASSLPRVDLVPQADEANLKQLQSQVQFYEQMKVVRLMRWLYPYHKSLVEWWRR